MNDVAVTIKRPMREFVYDQPEIHELDFVVSQVAMSRLKVVVTA